VRASHKSRGTTDSADDAIGVSRGTNQSSWLFSTSDRLGSRLPSMKSDGVEPANDANLPTYKELLEESEKHPIEEVGVRLRNLMPWVQKKNINGA
jgi:hypothetical protein